MFKTIRSKLISGIVLLLTLLSITSGVGLYYVFELDKNIRGLSEDITPTIESTDDMIASLWERGKVANEVMASESASEIVQLYQQFAPLNQVFQASYNELENLISGAEVQYAADAMEANTALIEHIDLMYESHTQELLEEEKAKSLLVEFDGIGAELIVALDEFATENEDEMAKAEEQGDALVGLPGTTPSDINQLLGDLFEHDYPVVEAALKLQRYVIEMQDTAGEYLAEEDPAKLPAIRKNFDQLGSQVISLMAILDNLAETQEDTEDAKQLRQNFNRWQSLALEDERLFDSYRDQLDAEAAADKHTEILESYITVADGALEKLAASADSISDSADERAASTVATAVSSVSIVWVIALVVGILVTVGLIRAIIKPVDQLLFRLNDIAQGEGDLTQRVSDSGKDEIAALGKAFNGFVEKIQSLVSQIATETQSLNHAVSSISEMSGKLSERVEVQSYEVESVVTAINQVNEAASSISSNTQACSDASYNASNDGEAAREVVQHAVTSVQGLAGDIDQSSTVINQLNSEVDRIVSVLDVIRDIAEQTNLLALNAAIEAARAGEQGRGFAVVADEVRTLASRTQNSTNEIQTMIESLQKGSSEAVSSMVRSKEGGETTVGYASNASDALERIAKSISDLNQMNIQIATAAEEQRAVVESANSNAKTVQDIVEESRTAVIENQEYTSSMQASLKNLSALVGQFKV